MLPQERFMVKGTAEKFPQDGGWVYVQSTQEYTEMFRSFEDRGVVAITATVGSTSWNTSLLPKGDGSHFVALPQKVRKKENIEVGQPVILTFQLRER